MAVLTEGTKVRMLIPGGGDVDLWEAGYPDDLPDMLYFDVPAGTVWEILDVDVFSPPQNLAYTIVSPNHVVNVIDDCDKERNGGEYPWEVVEYRGIKQGYVRVEE